MKLLLLFLVCFAGNAQIYNGHIQYGVSIGDIEGFSTSKSQYLKNGFLQAMENAPYLSYSLKFRDSVSEFKIDPTTGLDNNGLARARNYSYYMGPILQDHKYNYTRHAGEFGNFFIKKEHQKDWEFTSETKKIDGYTCYKAESKYIVVNPKGTFVFPLVAWFCPEIPIPFGPLGYGKLPGLILELQIRNVVYGVTKIQLNLDKEITIPTVGNTKVISEEEFNLMIDKTMKELAEKNKKRAAQKKFEELGKIPE